MRAKSVFKRLTKPQFSVMGLLILIAASALGIRYFGLPAYRKHLRETTLQKIAAVGGRWAGLSDTKRRLLLSGEGIDDSFLEGLGDKISLFPEIEQLDLFQTRVTDQGFEQFLTSPSFIKKMVVFENAISDAAFQEATESYPEIQFQKRKPDPIASGLTLSPVPTAAIVSLIVDPLSQLLLVGAGDGRMHQFDLSRNQRRKTDQAHLDWVFDMQISPNQRRLATVGGDRQLKIWKYPSIEFVTSSDAHRDDVHGVVWLDDDTLATASDDRALRLWRLDGAVGSLLEIASTENAHTRQIPRLRRIPNQKVADQRIADSRTTDNQAREGGVLSIGRDGLIHRWATEDAHFSLVQTFAVSNEDAADACINPNGLEFGSVDYDGYFSLWEFDSSQPTQRFRIANQRAYCLNINWQERVACVGMESCLALFDIDTGTLLQKRNDQKLISRIERLGSQLITTDAFGQLIVRDAGTLDREGLTQAFESEFDSYGHDFLQGLQPFTASVLCPEESFDEFDRVIAPR